LNQQLVDDSLIEAKARHQIDDWGVVTFETLIQRLGHTVDTLDNFEKFFVGHVLCEILHWNVPAAVAGNVAVNGA
jgi:hypothetical protein